MTELKTLKYLPRFFINKGAKEFGLTDPTTELIYIPDLKAEAVKHVKDWELKAKRNEELGRFKGVHKWNAKISAFKHFFNITEEDLKFKK